MKTNPSCSCQERKTVVFLALSWGIAKTNKKNSAQKLSAIRSVPFDHWKMWYIAVLSLTYLTLTWLYSNMFSKHYQMFSLFDEFTVYLMLWYDVRYCFISILFSSHLYHTVSPNTNKPSYRSLSETYILIISLNSVFLRINKGGVRRILSVIYWHSFISPFVLYLSEDFIKKRLHKLWESY